MNYATLIISGQGVVAVTEIALLVTFSVGLLFLDPLLTVFTIAFFLVIAIVLRRLLSGWAGRLGLRASNAEVASYAAI